MGPSDLVTLACCVVVAMLSPQLVSCNRQPPHDDHVKFKGDENDQDQQQWGENGGAGSVKFDTKTVVEEETSRDIDYLSCNVDVSEAPVAAALEHVQPYEDVSLGGSLKRFISGILRWVYEAITYDFCKAIEVDPSCDDVKTVIPLPPTKLAVVKEDPEKVEVPAKMSALSGESMKASLVSWWKRPPPQKGLTDLSYPSRVSCFLRRARDKMYQDKKTHPSIWNPADVCGTLCESCECNHDPNSTCAKELVAWRTQTKPLLFWTYAVLHRSRLLCAFGLLQSVLRKKYIYKTVMCMPLLILFFVLCKALITLVQLRKYLENSRTPAAYTRQGSNHHSEDDDVRSNMERRIQEVHIHADDKHPEKHADITLRRLNQNLTSLQTFCAFVDATRTYHKHKVEASLRQLLNTVLELNEVKT